MFSITTHSLVVRTLTLGARYLKFNATSLQLFFPPLVVLVVGEKPRMVHSTTHFNDAMVVLLVRRKKIFSSATMDENLLIDRSLDAKEYKKNWFVVNFKTPSVFWQVVGDFGELALR